jgi:phytoene/squalene synthetase
MVNKLTLNLAANITKTSSKQTFLTIRYLVDRDRIEDAYRAYAYFRWVDDLLDSEGLEESDRKDFLSRQKKLVDRCYRWERIAGISDHENLLVDLVRSDHGKKSGLRSYIHNMMSVMAFDSDRRGRVISQAELTRYSLFLATAVTDALHHFIGHDDPSPRGPTRYLAVTAAHITHMLRDAVDDYRVGYFNIPGEFLAYNGITPEDYDSEPYRAWVQSRVRLARAYFKAGRDYLAQVRNLRCYFAGYTYIARFEGVLDAIEQDGFRLRRDYSECKSIGSGLRMGWSAVSQAVFERYLGSLSRALPDR